MGGRTPLNPPPNRRKVLVLGFHFELYLSALHSFQKKIPNLLITKNLNPEEGQFSSILTGLKELALRKEDQNGVIIHTLDTPLVGEDLLRLFDKNGEAEVIKPVFKHKSGHPIYISHQVIQDLLLKESEKRRFRLDQYFKSLPQEKVKKMKTPSKEILKNLNTKKDWDQFLMPPNLLLRGGEIVLSSKTFKGDLLISKGKISNFASSLDPDKEAKVIDIEGKILMPEAIDPHTHMELPFGDFESSDDFKSGTKAALMGGTTTIIDFANQTKGDSALKPYQRWREKADSKVYSDYALHVSITSVNDQTLEEIKELYQKEGVSSFKTFMAYPQMQIMEEEFRKLVRFLNQNIPRYVLMVHAEMGSQIEELRNQSKERAPIGHPQTRPIETEVKAVEKFIQIIEEEKGRGYIVHLTSIEAMKILTKARERGVQVFSETCP